jgi:SAM-dependent methyltransferase
VKVFYEANNVPVNSVLLLPSKQEAQNFPLGHIDLGFCRSCGFIYNTAFDQALLEYSERYEPTQAYSATFNQWHRNLAEQLIERYDLHGKHLIEIGCGKGEFLTMLCELGGNSGVGFDPAYTPGRHESLAKDRINFVTDFYSEKYADYHGDFVCCKMTLEHIQPAADFVNTVRRSVGDQEDTTIFFQVPDVLRILKETAFWDIYYEHCSYYSLGSLARLFRRCNFSVIDLAREYDDQYIMVEARPNSNGTALPELPQEADLGDLAGLVEQFSAQFSELRRHWRERLENSQQQGQRVVVWGSGSKGVAFLTTLEVRDMVDYVVDINPNRQGYFMAGTGQEIVSPAFLKEYRPDVVIVMNPIYRNEIVKELHEHGLNPEVITT